MALPTYFASGAFSASISAPTAAFPASTLAKDIALLVIESENQTISLTTANGFVEVGSQTTRSAGTAATDPANRIAVYWKRLVGGDANPVVADSGDHTSCQIHVFRGCKPSGNPWDVFADGNDSGANDVSGVIPGATTTIINALVVLVCGTSFNGNSTAQFSLWANADLANILERTDNSNTAGLGGGHGMATGEKATAGPYTTTTVTLANTSFKGTMSMALVGAVDANGASVGVATPSIVGARVFAGVTSSTGAAVGAGTSGSTNGSLGASAGVAADVVAGVALWDTVAASTGLAADSVAGAALWDGVGASAGVAADIVVGTALWDSVGASTGVATGNAPSAMVVPGAVASTGLGTVLGDGANGASSGSTAAATGSANVTSDGVSVFAALMVSDGVGTGLSDAVALTLGTASAQGVGDATTIAVALWDTLASSNGLATATSLAASMFLAMFSATGVGEALGKIGEIIGADGLATGVALVVAETEGVPRTHGGGHRLMLIRRP